LRRTGRLTAALALALLAGCKTATEQLNEADRLALSGQYDPALDRYREVLVREDLNDSERERALRGRGEAYLAKNDLQNAEGCFKGLAPQSGTRSALLGHVAYLRRDTALAERLYREAYGRGERGLVTTRLAEVVGGEAQTPARISEAARLLRDGGGSAAVAQGLDEGAAVWVASDQGTSTTSALLARLDRAKQAAPTYISLELIRATLLARAGQPDRATQVYVSMSSFSPKPSDGFLQFVRAQQTSAAVFTGDTSRINQLAEAGMLPPDEAARVRAEIARSLESTGSVVEALEQWQKTASAGGAPAGRAWCEVARLEAIRGRSAESSEAWTKAAASVDDPATRALVALSQARGTDPLGARKALEGAANDASLDKDLREQAARSGRAVDRLKAALDEVANGSATRARSLARSALALAPELSLAVGLDSALAHLETGPFEKNEVTAAASLLAAIPASGDTKDALAAARTGRLLLAGLAEDAIKGAAKEPGAADELAHSAPRAIARLLAADKTEDAVSIVERMRAAGLGPAFVELSGRLRGDASFAALWGWKRFLDAAGPPDPLARRAPYACELTLGGGTTLGVVAVISADASGLVVRVPGRAAPVRVNPGSLVPSSCRGVDDSEFDRADKAARARREASE
jgi:hypothetical protein